MAAMQAISDHCGNDGIPLDLGDGMVQMVPRDDVQKMKNMQPGEMTEEELMQFVDGSPWLSEWTDKMCKNAGLTGGTQEYNDCVRRFARKALD